MTGSLAFGSSTLTISSGSVTATRSHHIIAAETGTTDDLTNITTGSVSDFCFLIIRNDSGDTITVKDAATGAGEIHMDDNADYVMSGDESLTLHRRGADWYETARSAGQNVLVQVKNTQTGAVATGTTTLPHDDTAAPQNDEGDEYMTLAITPTKTGNTLLITVTVSVAHSAAEEFITVALFQDTTAAALAAIVNHLNTGDSERPITFTHKMTAGTEISTTFKVRIGSSTAGTTTFNGVSAGRIHFGLMASSITIQEVVI